MREVCGIHTRMLTVELVLFAVEKLHGFHGSVLTAKNLIPGSVTRRLHLSRPH